MMLIEKETRKEKIFSVYYYICMLQIPLNLLISYILYREVYLIRMIPSSALYFFSMVFILPFLTTFFVFYRYKKSNKNILNSAAGLFFYPDVTSPPNRSMLLFSEFWLRVLTVSSPAIFILLLMDKGSTYVSSKDIINWFNCIFLTSIFLALLPNFIKTDFIKTEMKESEKYIGSMDTKMSFYKFLMLGSSMMFMSMSFEVAQYFDKSYIVLALINIVPVIVTFISIRIWKMQEIHLQYLKESKND